MILAALEDYAARRVAALGGDCAVALPVDLGLPLPLPFGAACAAPGVCPVRGVGADGGEAADISYEAHPSPSRSAGPFLSRKGRGERTRFRWLFFENAILRGPVGVAISFRFRKEIAIAG